MRQVRVLAAAVFRGVRAVGGGERCGQVTGCRRSGFEAEQRWEMLVAEPFGQHFAQLLARLDAAGETPEAERREAGHSTWCTGTGVTPRLTSDGADLMRQVAGQAVVEAFLAVLRVIQSHGVAMEVAGVCCQSTAVAEHSELIVDTVVREARQPYEHLVDVARRPGGRVSSVVTRLVIIIETFEKNPERILGVFIRVEDTFEIADEEHGNSSTGHVAVQLAVLLAVVWDSVAHLAEESAEVRG
ncbi:hypothetical protein BOVATA_026650 [Babesia ovata]|uniref:Uncharacterized protein n=1 Tax=Babesia ovata TaxID=189622 RepID=A0A2H6KDU7_9APIC|nr:uncharacterized protein BOVATA_026650 [Babesia ovata]GBE61172.1 hypothetical protein BOVATA_026650 [Babesia ovata]